MIYYRAHIKKEKIQRVKQHMHIHEEKCRMRRNTTKTGTAMDQQ